MNPKTFALMSLEPHFSVFFLRVILDLRDLPDLRVRRAREAQLVSLVLLALLVSVELE